MPFPVKMSVMGHRMAESINVLIVEDEDEIRDLMDLHLTRQGYRVQACSSAEEAKTKDAKNAKNANTKSWFDLVILDWMLPGISGLEFLQNLRRDNQATRILMVTAKTEPEDIVQGLEAGADDFLMKPFDLKIFLARVRALLRRPGVAAETQGMIEIGQLKLNQSTHEVFHEGVLLHLTPSEYKLLLTMMESQGRVLTRDQLVESVQGEGVNVIARTIDTHVFGLRKKLGTWSDRIETIRGVGYRVRLDG